MASFLYVSSLKPTLDFLCRGQLSQGFSNLAPEHSPDPMPEEAKFPIAAGLLEHDGAEGFAAAGGLITAFDVFFRPSEVLSIEAAHVFVLRCRKRRIGLPSVSITLAPLAPYIPGFEPPARTKAGEHDDSVVFGTSDGAPGGEDWVADVLAALSQKRRGTVFPVSLPRWEVLFKRSTARLNLSALKLTPHCAR